MAKVLIVGSGGREHALAWKVAQSDKVAEVFVCPGNGATCLPEDYDGQDSPMKKIVNTKEPPTNDFTRLAGWCVTKQIKLVVVGPEKLLADGIVDSLEQHGILCFGPSKTAARLEADKEFAKNFMVEKGIPTARFQSFTSYEEAENYILSAEYQALVVKASGLASGKGVMVCDSRQHACDSAHEMLVDRKFGSSGEVVVIEELLKGEEFSVLCFSDGENIAVMPPTQDHKRAYDEDAGPNTGGMGAYGPCPQVTQETLDFIKRSVLQRAIDGAREKGHPFVGVLYAGVMMTEDGPKVLEFNCRFGDPECQVLLSLLDCDLYEVMMQCCQRSLNPSQVYWRSGISSTCVVLASKGYPGNCEKNKRIFGIYECSLLHGLQVFEAGTAISNGVKVTSGGRVLGVTSVAESLQVSIDLAMLGAEMIDFEGKFYRKDIGRKGSMFNSERQHLTYESCGVNIKQGDAFVKKISPIASATCRSGCNSKLGGFGALFDLHTAGYSNPVLVSGTDGVGTKLLLAQEANQYSTIGQDLVAMCVNDILTHNAEPLYFLDYFSCGKLVDSVAYDVVEGIASACKACGCALAGGETAEMPDLYSHGQFDLAGFAVGAYEKNVHIPLPVTEEISTSDVIIGISSSGLHSNGFSLVRRVVKSTGLGIHSASPFEPGKTLAESLLAPTALYSKALLPVLRCNKGVKAAAHITGGGLPGNLSRVLPDHLRAILDAECWPILPVFGWLFKTGQVPPLEMLKTFNCGLGLCLVVAEDDHLPVLNQCKKNLSTLGLDAYVVGHVQPMNPTISERVVVRNFHAVLSESWMPPRGDCDANIGEKVDVNEPKVAVFISGTGTNLQSLIEYEKSGEASYKIGLVVSNKENAPGLLKARNANIPSYVLNHKKFATREEYDREINKALLKENIQLICLAGFMRLLSEWFTKTWEGRILNIHPSLLPSFKGINAHEQVLEAGVKVTGCTAHFVTEKMDEGAIIAQSAVFVERNDNVSTLSEKVKAAEHKVYPQALNMVAKENVKFDPSCNRVVWN